jgi:hypothetical protein
MTQGRFCVGDRVLVLDRHAAHAFANSTGTVVAVKHVRGLDLYRVQIDGRNNLAAFFADELTSAGEQTDSMTTADPAT